MARLIEVKLEKRGVSCIAELLDDLAPRTCEAIWNALPLGGDAVHAKYASNEVFTIVSPFADIEPGMENPTLTPTTGDLLYFFFPPGSLRRPDIQDSATKGLADLAIFYDRDNFLFSPRMGAIPGNRFGQVIENMDEMTRACDNIWREGFTGERLSFSRVE